MSSTQVWKGRFRFTAIWRGLLSPLVLVGLGCPAEWPGSPGYCKLKIYNPKMGLETRCALGRGGGREEILGEKERS